MSSFDKSRIHNNLIVTPSEFIQEVSGSCSLLCFIKNDLVDYIVSNQFHSIPEGSYIIEVVSGSLQFINGTEIYDQSQIMNAFMSSIQIDTSTIKNIQITKTPI